MSLELAIQENTATMKTLIGALQSLGKLEIIPVTDTPKQVAKQEKAKAPEKVAEPAPTPEPAPQVSAPEPTPASASASGAEVPFDVVKDALFKVAKADRDKAAELLKAVGASKMSEVPKDRYADLLASLNAFLRGD